MAFASDKTRQGAAGQGAAGGFSIDNSLRFNDDDSAYLQKTPSSAGNKRTFTHSFWVKRGNLFSSSQIHLFTAGNGAGSVAVIQFDNDSLRADFDGDSSGLKTTQVFRDTSAWYHFVIATDSTQSTTSDRVKIYCNGTQITDLSISNYPTLNEESTRWNNTVDHRIGMHPGAGSASLDAYLAEVHFIDGTALTPTSFGEEDTDYKHWKPIAYAGSYGTNGFYLPFNNDYTVEGFSTVTWKGNAADQYIGGVGFSPDLVWGKCRDTATTPHELIDTVRGTSKRLQTNTTGAETTASNDGFVSISNDGFLLDSSGGGGNFNGSGRQYVAWNWDMGGSTVSNTSGSITSSVRANPTYGQSIVSYTGQSGAQTVGHGLSSAPEMIIVKNRSSAQEWLVYHASNTSAPETDYLRLDTDSATADNTFWNDTLPTTSVFSVGDSQPVNSGHGNSYIAYCFHSVSGYSKFGSYTGTAATQTITTGFNPAFIMIKRTNTIGEHWYMYDNVRFPGSQEKNVTANNDSAESGNSSMLINYLSTGFQIVGTNAGINASGDSYIYMCFADKREAAFWLDQSGKNNDWTGNNLTESDISVDSPTNNFATWNPVNFYPTNGSLKQGSLEYSSTGYSSVIGTFGMITGKWYWEVYINSGSPSAGGSGVGIQTADGTESITATETFMHVTDGMGYKPNGGIRNNDVDSSYGATFTNGDIIGVALDMDAGTLVFYKNDVSQGTAVSSLTGRTFMPGLGGGNATYSWIGNFGQDSSFAGNKTAQGNQDSNSIGDFYYTPPTDYLALCTSNLTAPAVKPQENFNTVLWTASGSANQAITGVGFQPDFNWIKDRTGGNSHHLFDAVRGAGERIRSDSTAAEDTVNSHTAFNTDGFTLGAVGTGISVSGNSHVAWNWKAGNATLGTGDFTQGSIASTCSRNVDAGFSIVSYTGTGSLGTVGHGLASKPEMIIVKNRSSVNSWAVLHKGIASDYETDFIKLDTDGAATDNDAFWNDTEPTTSLFTVNIGSKVNGSVGGNENIIAYCFHSVDGYSKVGSWTSNNSADGTFVYTGFKPRYIMSKQSANLGDWVIFDTERNTYNESGAYLEANTSDAEYSARHKVDILSNGFKARSSYGEFNGYTSSTQIFIAFAEVPFKFSNAR